MKTLTASPARLAICGPTVLHPTREGWLTAAVEALRPLFAEVGAEIPALRVSVGFPGGGSARKRIGECWSTKSATDGVSNLFVSPVLDDRADVLAVLVHEIVHAVDDCQSGHKGAFTRMAKALGLEGKMTATVAGTALQERLARIATDLGAYPHGAVRLGSRRTGKGRMLKTECGECGFIGYTTRKWLDVYAVQPCACGGEIREA
jgi:hypothetical protein